MNELDEIWAQKLAEAAENARVSGRHDVADYLALKAANDAIRRTAVGWLFDTAVLIAAEANRTHSGIAIEREDPHNFSVRGANLVGSMLRVRKGVRCMTIEAGWTRTPADGFMRGGALAIARIVHFGMPKANSEFALVRNEDAPSWVTADDDRKPEVLHSDGLLAHFRIFHQI